MPGTGREKEVCVMWLDGALESSWNGKRRVRFLVVVVTSSLSIFSSLFLISMDEQNEERFFLFFDGAEWRRDEKGGPIYIYIYLQHVGIWCVRDEAMHSAKITKEERGVFSAERARPTKKKKKKDFVQQPKKKPSPVRGAWAALQESQEQCEKTAAQGDRIDFDANITTVAHYSHHAEKPQRRKSGTQ